MNDLEKLLKYFSRQRDNLLVEISDILVEAGDVDSSRYERFLKYLKQWNKDGSWDLASNDLCPEFDLIGDQVEEFESLYYFELEAKWNAEKARKYDEAKKVFELFLEP